MRGRRRGTPGGQPRTMCKESMAPRQVVERREAESARLGLVRLEGEKGKKGKSIRMYEVGTSYEKMQAKFPTVLGCHVLAAGEVDRPTVRGASRPVPSVPSVPSPARTGTEYYVLRTYGRLKTDECHKRASRLHNLPVSGTEDLMIEYCPCISVRLPVGNNLCHP